MKCFDDQSRLGARQPRHIEFELGVTEVAGFGGKLCHLPRALHACAHGSAADRLMQEALS